VSSVDVVVDAPVLEEHLSLEQTVEELTVQELVAQSAVERLDPGVLPWRSRVDEDGVDAGEPAPVDHGIGNELGSVVEAQVGRRSSLGHQLLQAAHDGVCPDGALGLDGQALTGTLVDDVQHLDGPPVGGLVELEVEGPGDIGGTSDLSRV